MGGDSLEDLVNQYRQLEALRQRPRGASTVQCAIHGLQCATAHTRKGENREKILRLVGAVFEAAVRLFDQVIPEGQVANALERGYRSAVVRMRRSTVHSTEELFDQWMSKTDELVRIFVRAESMDRVEERELRDATERFVAYVLDIAAVALRMLVRHQGFSLDDYNRDPGMIDVWWREAATNHLARLRSGRT